MALSNLTPAFVALFGAVAISGMVVPQRSANARTPAALRQGIMRAERFKSTQCLNARNEAGNWMQTSSRNSQVVYAGKVAAELVASKLLGPQPAEADKVDAIYISNQKAASTSSARIFKDFISTGRSPDLGPFRTTNDPGDCDGIDTSTSLTFTFVGEPTSIFFKGAIETICRNSSLSLAANDANPGKSVAIASRLGAAGWENISEDDAYYLFSNFLEDVENKRYLGPDAYHAWPQALKIDVDGLAGCMKFIGLAETLNASYAAIFPDVDENMFQEHRNRNGIDAGSDVKVCEESLTALLQKTPKYKKRMCSLLSVDYECFDFPVSSECS